MSDFETHEVGTTQRITELEHKVRTLTELADNRLADYVKMRSERDRLLAVPVAQDCVSDPREPTFAMSQAGTNIPIRIGRTEYFPLDAEVCAIYRAMCAASKEPK